MLILKLLSTEDRMRTPVHCPEAPPTQQPLDPVPLVMQILLKILLHLPDCGSHSFLDGGSRGHASAGAGAGAGALLLVSCAWPHAAAAAQPARAACSRPSWGAYAR